jgi:FkbM family methyltransferase
MISRTIHNLLNQGIPRGLREALRGLAISTIPSMRHLDMWTRLRQLAEIGFSPNVIYDVGASQGLWAQSAMKVWPSAEVVGFEPNLSRVEALNRLATESTKFRFFTCFLGAKEQVVQYCDRGDQTSLFLDGNERASTAPMRVLDSLVAKESLPLPDLVKLDVQGAELDVLTGSSGIVEHAEVILAEVSLYRLRKDMPTALELWSWLDSKGFALYDVVSMLRREKDDALVQMDFLFLRRTSPLYRDAWE